MFELSSTPGGLDTSRLRGSNLPIYLVISALLRAMSACTSFCISMSTKILRRQGIATHHSALPQTIQNAGT